MEEKLENVVEETTKVTEKVEKTKKPNVNEDGDYVVDLNKPKEDEVKKDNPDNEGVVAVDDNADTTEKQEEVQPKVEAQEAPVLEEITEEEVQEQTEELTEQVEEAVAEAQETGKALPENVQKLMDFMEETGGTIEDYTRLNADYSSVDENILLKENIEFPSGKLESKKIDLILKLDKNILSKGRPRERSFDDILTSEDPLSSQIESDPEY